MIKPIPDISHANTDNKSTIHVATNKTIPNDHRNIWAGRN
jgi:hypothetical protein